MNEHIRNEAFICGKCRKCGLKENISLGPNQSKIWNFMKITQKSKPVCKSASLIQQNKFQFQIEIHPQKIALKLLHSLYNLG